MSSQTVVVEPQPANIITIEGPKNARTDPESGLRFYRWKGVEYPSVTTVRRVAGLPHGLHQWSLSRVIERATENYGALGAMMAEEAAGNLKEGEVRRWLRAAATEERDYAADKGNRVHFAAASGQPLDEVDDDIAEHVRQLHDFYDATQADIVCSESQVFNLSLGYAGSLDTIADLTVHGQRARYLVDYKTSKSLYLDHAMQVHAYAGAEFVGADDVEDDYATTALKTVTRLAVLHITSQGWHLAAIKPSRVVWDAFTGLLAFARMNRAFPKGYEDLVETAWSAEGMVQGPHAVEPTFLDALLAQGKLP